jgi:hypothetical protein
MVQFGNNGGAALYTETVSELMLTSDRYQHSAFVLRDRIGRLRARPATWILGVTLFLTNKGRSPWPSLYRTLYCWKGYWEDHGCYPSTIYIAETPPKSIRGLYKCVFAGSVYIVIRVSSSQRSHRVGPERRGGDVLVFSLSRLLLCWVGWAVVLCSGEPRARGLEGMDDRLFGSLDPGMRMWRRERGRCGEDEDQNVSTEQEERVLGEDFGYLEEYLHELSSVQGAFIVPLADRFISSLHKFYFRNALVTPLLVHRRSLLTSSLPARSSVCHLVRADFWPQS